MKLKNVVNIKLKYIKVKYFKYKMSENKEENKKQMLKTNFENKEENIESNHKNKTNTLVTDIIIHNYDKMDTNNKAASDVILEKGMDAGRDFMFSSAGFDYARMRSMYG
jgi:hypothetical protein